MPKNISALCLIGAASLLEGQIATAGISGYVKDSSTAAIPNVTVTAKMLEQQTTRVTQTGSDGHYNFLAVPPGTYELAFESRGFKKQVNTGVDVTVNQNLRVDATLEVGSIETQVTVTSTAPLVDTSSPTLSGLIDDRRVVDLPLNGRNVIGLARVLPRELGVSAPQQLDNERIGPKMNVNGGRDNMNLFT